MRLICMVVVASLLAVAPVGAQVRADPGVVIGNRIAVRVNVTLADEETPYSPVRDLTLAFTGGSTPDTVSGRTDEAGVVTVLLRPGKYVVSASRPYAWKGTWYTWRVPIDVRHDMPAVDLNRANARVGGGGARTATAAATPPTQSSGPIQSRGDVSNPATRSSRGGDDIAWLSAEVGGEGGLTRLGSGSESDAGYGGSGSFVGGVGPLALAVGYRYTSIRYGNDLEPGSMRGASVELRYHFRPGTAPIRPYVGAVAGIGRWYDSESLSDEKSNMQMYGGTLGVQFGLATSVRLHLAATAAGTSVKTPGGSSSGLFTTGHLGLTFDIFSPAR